MGQDTVSAHRLPSGMGYRQVHMQFSYHVIPAWGSVLRGSSEEGYLSRCLGHRGLPRGDEVGAEAEG